MFPYRTDKTYAIVMLHAGPSHLAQTASLYTSQELGARLYAFAVGVYCVQGTPVLQNPLVSHTFPRRFPTHAAGSGAGAECGVPVPARCLGLGSPLASTQRVLGSSEGTMDKCTLE